MVLPTVSVCFFSTAGPPASPSWSNHSTDPERLSVTLYGSAGVPAPVADNLARYYVMVKAGEFAMVTPTVADVLGRPGRTFQEWVAENAGAFAA